MSWKKGDCTQYSQPIIPEVELLPYELGLTEETTLGFLKHGSGEERKYGGLSFLGRYHSLNCEVRREGALYSWFHCCGVELSFH